MRNLIFLKLGGSLITDKKKPHTPNIDIIKRVAEEIKSAISQTSHIQLVSGHGSGSFGHIPAKKYNTRQGVNKAEEWIGLQKVWYEARALNQIIIEIFSAAGIPTIAFPPSASLVSSNRKLSTWNVDPIIIALQSRLIPLINGDVIKNEKVTPKGTPASKKPKNIGMDEHEQKGVTAPNREADKFPKPIFIPVSHFLTFF